MSRQYEDAVDVQVLGAVAAVQLREYQAEAGEGRLTGLGTGLGTRREPSTVSSVLGLELRRQSPVPSPRSSQSPYLQSRWVSSPNSSSSRSPVRSPASRWSLGKVQQVVEEELTDDAPVKQDLMELQMQLELGDIDDDEYVRREAAVMQRLREVRAWRERLGKATAAVRCASRGRPRRGVSGIDALLASLPRRTHRRRQGRRRQDDLRGGARPLRSATGSTHARRSRPIPPAALADVLGLASHRRRPARSTKSARSGRSQRRRQRSCAPRFSNAGARRAGARSSIAARISTARTVDGLVDATLPGVDEIFALLALADSSRDHGD